MKFTEQEMVFLNSLSDGPSPFGISLTVPSDEDKEHYLVSTIQSLKEKNIVDADSKLSKLGVIPVKVLEIYKNADEHILLNRLCMCRTSDNQLICILPDENGYDMFSVDPSVILLMLLKQSSYLCKAQEKDVVPYLPQKMDYVKWQQSTAPFAGHSVVVGKFQKDVPILEKNYYWDEQNGFQYDFHTEEQTQLNPREMRLQFMDIFGIPYETEGLKIG